MLSGWYELLTEVATEAAARFGGLGRSPAEAAALIVNAFIGAEATAAPRVRPQRDADQGEPAPDR